MTNIFDTHAHYASRQFDGDVRRQVTAAGRNGMHRCDQLIRATAFRKETTRARVERLLHQRRAVVDGEHDNRHSFW